MTKPKKFWNLNQMTKNSAEITIYGDIGNSWWNDSISAKQFSDDLKSLGDEVEQITVRLNSAGGSVFEGLTIRSILKNHKADVTVHIDGYAASIASIIAMAGDKIVMAKGSMMMIHNPMSSMYGGEAKDFREAANLLDKIRDSLVSVYANRTGLSTDELIQMLDDETWMSAEEAVQYGFADEIEDGSPVTASIRGAVASVNGVSLDFSNFHKAPKLPSAAASFDRQAPQNKPIPNDPNNGGATMLSLEELKNKYPDVYTEAVAAGINQERIRMQALDNLAMPGNADIIAKAKADGTSVAETAVNIIKAENAKRAAANTNIQNDANASGVNAIDPGAAEDLTQTEEEKSDAHADALAKKFIQRRGGIIYG
ncbi:head maturation protease, ClpP-related [Paenibacillus sp. UNC451MF]|uniref:head maturation protease, ClpP-related n=1 Tax=Paenibacillus sp. UNC451MF TaxID=1449063 RepID=UPI00068F8636|nr:head maturation protease, ClpP-related [Paenibacillus sp. UNC451MF]